MIILVHILIAVSGLVQATYGALSPSRTKLKITYGLTAATFASGAYLVWDLHASILKSCMQGLLYLGIIIVTTAVTSYRLAHARVSR